MDYSYIEALGVGFPLVQATTFGETYGELQWVNGQPMPSKEELDAWIAANPKQNFTGFLQDGTPAYFDNTEKRSLSINKTIVTFSLDTKGARNFYLDYQGQPGVDSGFVLGHKAALKEISVSFKRDANSSVKVTLKDTLTKVDLASIVVPQGSRIVSVPITSIVLMPTSISCYLENEANIANPIVTATLVQCD